MINKDKRSLLLSLILGDGCLHYIKNNGKLYGEITIDHGITQADYQSWKAQLLSDIFNKKVTMRPGHNGKSIRVSVSLKRLRAWRKFTYPNNKKSIPKILKFVRHPELAISVWLMDDGYVESSEYKGRLSYSAFRLFVCDQTEEELQQIKKWLIDNFDIESTIKYQKKKDKKYPYIKINMTDSLKLWKKIREFILQFKSMRHKFRYLESSYQFKILQRTPSTEIEDDIVQTVVNK